jgi:hypothetical protein
MDYPFRFNQLRANNRSTLGHYWVELTIKFEREFGFEISDEAVESILTVGDAVKFLEKHAVT